MAYDQNTAKQIDKLLNEGYVACRDKVTAKDYKGAREAHVKGLQDAAVQITGGTNTEATKSLIESLGANSKIEQVIASIESNAKVTPQERDLALAEASRDVCSALFQAYGQHVPAADENNREARKSLAAYRLEKLIEAIRV